MWPLMQAASQTGPSVALYPPPSSDVSAQEHPRALQLLAIFQLAVNTFPFCTVATGWPSPGCPPYSH